MTKIEKNCAAHDGVGAVEGPTENITPGDKSRLEYLIKRKLHGILGVPAQRATLDYLSKKYPQYHQLLHVKFSTQIENEAGRYELEAQELEARCHTKDPAVLRVIQRWINEKRELDFTERHILTAPCGSPWTGPDRRTFMNQAALLTARASLQNLVVR